MEIRQFDIGDSAAVIELWRSAGLLWPSNDPMRDIERKMDNSPWGFLVVADDHEIIGSVMVGYDGHRGWVNYLACHPDHRRRGVATALMTRASEMLAPRGCPKINLQVRAGNEAAVKFYESIGFAAEEVSSLGLRLVDDNVGENAASTM